MRTWWWGWGITRFSRSFARFQQNGDGAHQRNEAEDRDENVNDMRMRIRMAMNIDDHLNSIFQVNFLRHQHPNAVIWSIKELKLNFKSYDAVAVALGYGPSMMLLAWAAKAWEKPLTMANTNKWHQWKLQSIQSVAMATPIYKSKASLWSFFSQLKVKKHQEWGLSTDQSWQWSVMVNNGQYKQVMATPVNSVRCSRNATPNQKWRSTRRGGTFN